MPTPDPARAPRPRSRFSTGFKMLLILSTALLPLGLVALFASREAAEVNRLRQESAARAMANASAIAIVNEMRPVVLGLRQAIDDNIPLLRNRPMDARQCRQRLEGLSLEQSSTRRFAIFDAEGRQVCATRAYSGLKAYPGQSREGFEIFLAARLGLVRAVAHGSEGGYFGVAEFTASRIAEFALGASSRAAGIRLSQGSQEIGLVALPPERMPSRVIRVSTPVAGGQLGLELAMPDAPISALEILLILLPILMWASGGLIGWLVVERLLLYPLEQMRDAVAAFRAGEGPIALPRLRTPARELTDLATSFEQATDALTAHERELAEGLARQKILTREVHHRVKNNLQIVSSLISLHARTASSAGIEEAYACIQRRVDALAVVYRHHYAEIEEQQGIPLRTMLGDLTSNLRGTIPRSGDAERARILLELDAVTVSQDVAAPVALLVTELLERVLTAPCPAPVTLSLVAEGKTARLSIVSDALSDRHCSGKPGHELFDRVVTGLSRQLRAPLEKDSAKGRYEIRIALLPTEKGSDET